jgi:hypothetical protein
VKKPVIQKRWSRLRSRSRPKKTVIANRPVATKKDSRKEVGRSQKDGRKEAGRSQKDSRKEARLKKNKPMKSLSYDFFTGYLSLLHAEHDYIEHRTTKVFIMYLFDLFFVRYM